MSSVSILQCCNFYRTLPIFQWLLNPSTVSFLTLSTSLASIESLHRIWSLAISNLMACIAFLSRSNVPILALSLCLLLSNLSASLVEVANDAIVAEAEKQKNLSSSSAQEESSSSSGELPLFVWMVSSLGGILGNLLGGIAIKTFSAQSTFLVFGVLALVQFFVTINIREKSLNLPENPSPAGIRNHISELSCVLRKLKISYSIAWIALSTAVVPVLTGTMFFYQTKILKIDASLVGISKVFGQMAMLLWGAA